MVDADLLTSIKGIMNSCDKLEFSFLFGSRARGDFTSESDWDFAVWISEDVDVWDRLIMIEDIRAKLSTLLGVGDSLIQIVDLPRAGLSISNTVVEEGLVITGEGTLSLARFYTRTWSLLEDFYWRQQNEPRDVQSAS